MGAIVDILLQTLLVKYKYRQYGRFASLTPVFASHKCLLACPNAVCSCKGAPSNLERVRLCVLSQPPKASLVPHPIESNCIT